MIRQQMDVTLTMRKHLDAGSQRRGSSTSTSSASCCCGSSLILVSSAPCMCGCTLGASSITRAKRRDLLAIDLEIRRPLGFFRRPPCAMFAFHSPPAQARGFVLREIGRPASWWEGARQARALGSSRKRVPKNLSQVISHLRYSHNLTNLTKFQACDPIHPLHGVVFPSLANARRLFRLSIASFPLRPFPISKRYVLYNSWQCALLHALGQHGGTVFSEFVVVHVEFLEFWRDALL